MVIKSTDICLYVLSGAILLEMMNNSWSLLHLVNIYCGKWPTAMSLGCEVRKSPWSKCRQAAAPHPAWLRWAPVLGPNAERGPRAGDQSIQCGRLFSIGVVQHKCEAYLRQGLHFNRTWLLLPHKVILTANVMRMQLTRLFCWLCYQESQ